MESKSLWRKYASDWKNLTCKILPYVLVAVLASTTVVAVLDMRDTRHKYTDIENTKAELETTQQELHTTLTQTKDLLEYLRGIEDDALLLKNQTEASKTEIAEKIAELENILALIDTKEQQKWILPMQYKNFSSTFGYREHPVEGELKFHNGVDLAADTGTPILAARSGTVEIAEYIENDAGYWVLIDHMDGYESAYMHMDRYIVTQGQFVQAGQIIGYCGASGVATDSHLHFEIRKDNRVVNPADYIDFK